MSYTALYRKWRPMIFDEVVGQDQVIKTIRSQVKSNTIQHAYLFSGTRGTGKTSTAKILSRAVNCLTPNGENPCNTCEMCKGIIDETLMDIIEIDAASNNGVDDIRELRENVKYPPARAKYKVYIIDEVHMLSTGAFNALLKTLEEPPHYVIFILATTEPHKIPATILSRCQKFDFKRVSVGANQQRIAYILGQMNIEFEQEAIDLIIQNADGAVRDALSLLDKCIESEGQKLTFAHAMESLGLVMDDILFEFSRGMSAKDTESLFNQIDQLNENGKDLTQFLKRLIVHYRNFMMVKVGADISRMVKESEGYIEELEKQAGSLSLNTLIRWINVLSTLENELKWTSQGRILFEVAIAKLVNPEFDQSVEGLIERIEQLEKGVMPVSIIKQQQEVSSKSVAIVSQPKAEIKAEVKEETKVEVKQETKLETKAETKPEVILERKSEVITQSAAVQSPAPVSKEANPVENTYPKEQVENSDLKRIQEAWDQILTTVKEKNVRVHAFLIEGAPKVIENNFLMIGFEDVFGFHVDMLSRTDNTQIVQTVISSLVQKEILVKCIFNSSLAVDDSTEEATPTDELDALKSFLGDISDNVEIIE